MIIEVGHFALVMAFFMSLVQIVACLHGARYGKVSWMNAGRQAALSGYGLVSVAFFSLVHAFALSDFSVLNVAQNSHTMKPVLFKISALWGNHEGSMLLWVWMLSLWGAFVIRRARDLDPVFAARATAVQGMIFAGFALFILAVSNPFLRLDPAAPEGLDLNPLLQDVLLVVHPPFLYMGYVGFSIAFSFAVAALLDRHFDQTKVAAFGAALKPWVLAAWVFLTVGIGLGSFWAYYELGWGGFWFWDPVENASLLPWLAGTALLHSLAVVEKRKTLLGWTLFLAILCFSLSLLGTFLVRSGLLTSVHAFAVDPERGVFILALLVCAIGGALFLFGARAPALRAGAPFSFASRETALLLNNVFFFTFTATVFIGTLYPLFLDALGMESVSVGPPYYAAVLLPLLLPFAALMGVAPYVSWRRAAAGTLPRLGAPLVIAVLLTIPLFFMPVAKTPAAIILWVAAAWISAALVVDLARKSGDLKQWRHLPTSYFAMILAHAGLAVMLVGIAGATQWHEERTVWVKEGERIRIAGFHLTLLTTETGIGQNYNYDRAVFSVELRNSDKDGFAFLMPERRWYPAAAKQTSETALLSVRGGILYTVLGERDLDNNRWVLRVYHHPLLLLIYAGGVMFALGGLLAMLTPKKRETAHA